MHNSPMQVRNEVDVEQLSLAELLYRVLICPDPREQQIGSDEGWEVDRKKPETRKYL